MTQLDSEPTFIPSAVRSIGIMSPAIYKIHGNDNLNIYLNKIVALSEKYLITEASEEEVEEF
jgi:hypothetical protein